MPIFKQGEMFRASGFIIVTTNSFLTSEEKLVMGKGAAWQLKMKVPGIDRIFGKMINEKFSHLGCYGLIFHRRYGAFQVKYMFSEVARMELIRHNTTLLSQIAVKHHRSIFNINYPGIGNGRLKEDQVRPVIEKLPQNVHIWKKKEVW